MPIGSNRFRTLSLLVCLTLSAAWADQVVMKNGDRVTGSIVKKDGKTLTIKTEQFGVVTTSWDQVASITAEKPVTVDLPDGKTVQGTLATADGKIEVTTKDAKLSVAQADVGAIRDEGEQRAYERLLHPGLGQLWAGTISAGFAGTSGNARTLTFTSGVNAVRATRTDKTTLYFNTIKASAFANGKNSPTARAIRGGIGYDHNVSPRLFVNVFNDYEFDKFQNLDLRFVLGGGLGFHAFKSESARLDVVAGGNYNRSSYSTPKVTKAGEIFWGDDYALKMGAATSLVQSFRMFNDMSHSGDYRVNFDIGMSTKLKRWLSWNISISDRYLSHPADGRKTNDLLYTTGLGITFSR